MNDYRETVIAELEMWEDQLLKPPSLGAELTSNFQERVNRVIPDKIHSVVTAAIREMTRAVIIGSQFSTSRNTSYRSLRQADAGASRKVRFYSSSAAAEGAVTGFGGILLGLADLALCRCGEGGFGESGR